MYSCTSVCKQGIRLCTWYIDARVPTCGTRACSSCNIVWTWSSSMFTRDTGLYRWAPECVYRAPDWVQVEPEIVLWGPDCLHWAPECVHGAPDRVQEEPKCLHGAPECVKRASDFVHSQQSLHKRYRIVYSVHGHYVECVLMVPGYCLLSLSRVREDLVEVARENT